MPVGAGVLPPAVLFIRFPDAGSHTRDRGFRQHHRHAPGRSEGPTAQVSRLDACKERDADRRNRQGVTRLPSPLRLTVVGRAASCVRCADVEGLEVDPPELGGNETLASELTGKGEPPTRSPAQSTAMARVKRDRRPTRSDTLQSSNVAPASHCEPRMVRAPPS